VNVAHHSTTYTVAGRLDGSFLSAVNLSEVLQKHQAVGTLSGPEAAGFAGDLASLGLSVASFGEREAAVAAVMWDETRPPQARTG
jgi:hypothetical protein